MQNAFRSLALALAFLARPAAPCTNYLVSKGASVDGSTFITYVADSHTLYGELYYTPARDHLADDQRTIIEWDTGKRLGQIPEVAHTVSVVGNMNEHQVSIGETTFGGRKELVDPTGHIDYGSLMYVALERSKTAREAIAVMTALAVEHGYMSEGESFSVADPNEVWLLEMVGKGPGKKGAVWAAVRIPDGYVAAHANQSRIRRFPLHKPDEATYAPDVISLARERGWFAGRDEEFSFADAYAPMTCDALRFCEARVWSFFRRVAPSLGLGDQYVTCSDEADPLPLWVKPDRKLGPRDLFELMRDHFEGTALDLSKEPGAGPYGLPYRWRPLTWTVDGVKYFNERAVSTQQTGFSFIAQARAWMPAPVGGVLWFGVDDTASTVYVPMYAGVLEPPHPFAVGTGTFQRLDWEAAFWVFNQVANFAYGRYSEVITDVRAVQRDLEGQMVARQADVEARALKLWKDSPERARSYLTRYSADQATRTVKRWRRLGEELLVKYLDGNTKDELGNVLHPGYSEEFYRDVARQGGERLKLKRLKSEAEQEEPFPLSGWFHSRDELGDLAKEVPIDFPFDKEKLMLVPGSDICQRPPQCCVAPKAGARELLVELPEPPKDACGARSWLVRVANDEKRPLVRKAGSE